MTHYTVCTLIETLICKSIIALLFIIWSAWLCIGARLIRLRNLEWDAITELPSIAGHNHWATCLPSIFPGKTRNMQNPIQHLWSTAKTRRRISLLLQTLETWINGYNMFMLSFFTFQSNKETNMLRGRMSCHKSDIQFVLVLWLFEDLMLESP